MCNVRKQRRPNPLVRTGPGKEAEMRLSIRRNKGKAEIRLELGDFAITLEIPV
jgi:hypothetical protein